MARYRDGDRSAAHHLARTTGTTVGDAADAIGAARRLEQLPEAAAAARRGELSAAQVSAIADPSAETGLVDQARRSSLQELKDHCARTKAAATADAEARRKRIHTQRFLRTYTDTEGAWHMHVRNNPEVGAEIMTVIDVSVTAYSPPPAPKADANPPRHTPPMLSPPFAATRRMPPVQSHPRRELVLHVGPRSSCASTSAP